MLFTLNKKSYLLLSLLVLAAGFVAVSMVKTSRSAINDCCYHECTLIGERRCIGNVVFMCCPNCDNDEFYDLCAPDCVNPNGENCTLTGQVCVGGFCTGAICTPDGCNSFCPPGCTVAEDPDCGCLNGNGCCGLGCTHVNDNDCSAICVANGCNNDCPIGCTIAEDPDCGCQDDNGCCGLGCTSANDNDCSATACADGTPFSTCSVAVGPPWYCNNVGSLLELCSTCGCASSWICGPEGTYCCDNQCNGTCAPTGCTVSYDPDCGCSDGDGCCGLGCTDANDTDCISALTATITNPPDGAQFPQDATIIFQGIAAGGTPGYTYSWTSDVDGFLGTGQTITVP